MATGISPFYDGSNNEKVIQSTINDEPNIPPSLNEDLKDLLGKLLEKDPQKRLGVYGSVRHHPFYSSINWVELERKRIPPPFQPKAVSMFCQTLKRNECSLVHTIFLFCLFDFLHYLLPYQNIVLYKINSAIYL
ncbi:protein kinase C theta type-like [Xenopus laevis]|uniref:Protein kinase C theta type-like n=1 Tax=Xenopus laevis TaxID=8355 RepID=A0A8J1M3A7_XENLA|nr:protein kinase C theta type-like [Xenopus laevis]